jgi:hypothetical protein
MRLLLDGSPVSADGYLLRGQGSRTRKAQAQAGEGGMTHLWEADHPYYCSVGNYYAPRREQPMAHYRSWADFMSEEGDSDRDYNLLFRWDWREGGDWGHGTAFNGDENYRNGVLLLFWMGQRKGLYRWTEVEVCRADEPAVREFLGTRMKHLLSLWEPIVGHLKGNEG